MLKGCFLNLAIHNTEYYIEIYSLKNRKFVSG